MNKALAGEYIDILYFLKFFLGLLHRAARCKSLRLAGHFREFLFCAGPALLFH